MDGALRLLALAIISFLATAVICIPLVIIGIPLMILGILGLIFG
ncbi:MAG: hypothetical protein NZ879_05390 [Archaeoglobaceae archaeon]|nr:hypothetical protein [Archaeoglobaceae archaeon]MDW8118401.1 hypothetical protein [Archaeoglobaceae archaeon]